MSSFSTFSKTILASSSAKIALWDNVQAALTIVLDIATTTFENAAKIISWGRFAHAY